MPPEPTNPRDLISGLLTGIPENKPETLRTTNESIRPLDADQKRTRNVMERIQGPNRRPLEQILLQRENRGLKSSTNARWIEALQLADQYFQGQPLAGLAVEDWDAFVAWMRRRYAHSSVYSRAAFIKSTLADLMGIDEIPKTIRRALTVREPPRRPQGRLVSDDDFRRLLTHTGYLERHGYNDRQRLQLMAILWVLRDSGMRASEMLALRVGSIEYSDQAAYLRLPADAPRLKTGPREIAVARCIPAIKAWLEAHPAQGDANAPLFPVMRSRQGRRPMRYAYLQQIIRHLGDATGINRNGKRDKPLTCHDFRHTRATEASRANWHPTKMEAYFGWAPGSKMASRYSHLARSDLKDQVLQDAALHGLGRTSQPSYIGR